MSEGGRKSSNYNYDKNICKKGSGKIKLTHAFVKEQFRKSGCTLIEEKYVNSATKMGYICNCGNTSQISYNNFQQGKRCKQCRISRATLTYAFVKSEFTKGGCVLLDTEYINSRTNMGFVCSCGNTAKIPYNRFRGGQRCKKCGIAKVAKAITFNYKNGPDFDHYSPKIPTEEVRRNPKDKKCLQVKCKNCNEWMTPTSTQVTNRSAATDGIHGEHNFYCGIPCKNACLLYGYNTLSTDPRSTLYIPKSEKEETRKCQTTHLKQLQCDETGHNYCEKCGDIIDVELHHTLEVAKYGMEAINSAGYLLLCFKCHTGLQKECT